MSEDPASTRADIVAALSTVRVRWRDDEIRLTAHENIPKKPRPFDAWIEWHADERGYEAKYLQTTWSVVVTLLPEKTENWTALLDALRWPIRVGLERVGHVGRAALEAITDGDHSYRLPAIRYALTSTVEMPVPIGTERPDTPPWER